MKTRALVMVTLLLLAACSKVTQENFAKIQDGMSEPEVHALLGPPTTSSSVDILGISGTHSRWESSDPSSRCASSTANSRRRATASPRQRKRNDAAGAARAHLGAGRAGDPRRARRRRACAQPPVPRELGAAVAAGAAHRAPGAASLRAHRAGR